MRPAEPSIVSTALGRDAASVAVTRASAPVDSRMSTSAVVSGRSSTAASSIAVTSAMRVAVT
jgi:hypothetical protein